MKNAVQNIQFVDTHCHLYATEFDADRSAVLERAVAAGVVKCFLPAIDSKTLDAMLAVEKAYPDHCIVMAGLHPCSVNERYKDELRVVENMLQKRKFAAIGEIGLDFYWDKTFIQQQYDAFQVQIEWAKIYGLPIVIHSRASMEECIGIVEKNQDGRLKGIFHCFSGSDTDAQRIINLGFHLGIGGVLTYKKSNLPGILKSIDLQHVVLETDAPYLSPVPHRGKRNESSYLLFVAQKLAEIKELPVSEIAKATTANAEKIFNSEF